MAKLFFSYSHRDEGVRDELEVHLTMLKRQGAIETWHDRRIQAGDEWKGEISEHLEEADIILLLVSPYFLASNYCYDVEMTRALERHEAKEARVIPVIVDPCDWHTAPFGKLQAATIDGKAISKYPNKHDAFLEVVQAIRSVVDAPKAGTPRQRPKRSSVTSNQPATIVPEIRSSNLRVKKTFTDHDRHTFLESSFEYMAKFFEGSLAELQSRNQGITSKFRRVTANHFTAAVYRGGKIVSECGVRMDDRMMGKQIVFSHQPDSTSSWNESLRVEEDGNDLGLKPGGLSRVMGGERPALLSQEGASELFWSLLIEPLQR